MSRAEVREWLHVHLASAGFVRDVRDPPTIGRDVRVVLVCLAVQQRRLTVGLCDVHEHDVVVIVFPLDADDRAAVRRPGPGMTRTIASYEPFRGATPISRDEERVFFATGERRG